MNAIIYCRVSTKEQAESGFSLDAQEKSCREFANKNGYEVIKVFIEKGESAKTQDRTELQKLIKYVINKKKHITAIIIWKYDRLTRNLSDQTELVKNFSKLNVRVLSTTENNEENSTGKLMRNIIGSFAQYENDVKSERTISGMKQACKDGRWCWPAPIGYKNTRDSSNKPLIVPTEDSVYIKKIFELASLDIYKQTEILELLKNEGFNPISKNMLNRLLRNPLYCGLIKVKWFDEYLEAIHEPIVSKELFFKVQNLINDKYNLHSGKLRNHPDFPLRNFVMCPSCEVKFTGGWSTGRKGRKYAYYNCRTRGCSFNIKREVLEVRFLEFLKEIQPKRELINLFQAIANDVWNQNKLDSMKLKRKLAAQIKSLKDRRNKVEELLINGTFDEQIYKRKSEELNHEILSNEISLQEYNNEIEEVGRYIEFCKYFLNNVSEIWLKGDINLRRKVQNLIFPDRIYFENEEFRTTEIAPVFNLLKGNNINKFNLVAPTGFEPVFQP